MVLRCFSSVFFLQIARAEAVGRQTKEGEHRVENASTRMFIVFFCFLIFFGRQNVHRVFSFFFWADPTGRSGEKTSQKGRRSS